MWVGKIALFVKASVAALACGALAMCAMWVGVSIVFLRVGEKKQNKKKKKGGGGGGGGKKEGGGLK